MRASRILFAASEHRRDQQRELRLSFWLLFFRLFDFFFLTVISFCHMGFLLGCSFPTLFLGALQERDAIIGRDQKILRKAEDGSKTCFSKSANVIVYWACYGLVLGTHIRTPCTFE